MKWKYAVWLLLLILLCSNNITEQFINTFYTEKSDKYNVYIVANNRSITDEQIKKVKTKLKPNYDKDFVIYLNTMIFLNKHLLKPNLFIFRHAKGGWHGFKKFKNNFKNFKELEYLLLYGSKSEKHKNVYHLGSYENPTDISYFKNNYNIKSPPSTGFWVIEHFYNNPKINKIYLVFFNFEKEIRDMKQRNYHPYTQEYNICKTKFKDKVVFIN